MEKSVLLLNENKTMNSNLSEYIINGEEIESFQDFIKFFNDNLWKNYKWNGKLDAFNDLLRGDFGSPPEGFLLIWKNSDETKNNIGENLFNTLVEIISDHGPGGNESEDNVILRFE